MNGLLHPGGGTGVENVAVLARARRPSAARYGVTAAALLLVGLVAACEEEPTSIDDLDTVVTLYDSNVDFGRFLTYAMPDSIMAIGGDTTFRLSRVHDQLILNEIAEQMAARGYVRVTDPASEPPDLAVLVGVTSSEHVGYATYPGSYWDWWYGWDWWVPLDESWGFYYPWYSTTVVYTYRTGTLLIDMFDPRLRDDQLKLIGSLWIGAVNGVLEGDVTEGAIRLEDGITRAFEQSPYLHSNGQL